MCLFELVSGNIHPDESLTRNGNMPPQKSHLALDQEIECFSKAGAISRTGRGLFSRFRGGACAHGSAVHAAIYGADLPVVDYVAFNGGHVGVRLKQSPFCWQQGSQRLKIVRSRMIQVRLMSKLLNLCFS